jgi:serine/threonine protein kinase
MVNMQKLKKPVVFTTTFTSYTADAIVGEGGSGRIYKAVDDDGEVVAIKLLEPSKITREKIKRFKNELNFCQINKHKNILSVYDSGILINEAKGSPFYVMPLFDGSLRDLLQKGIPVDRVLSYLSQILDGVEAAHMKQVIHRDLKPENLLYDAKTDSLVVADFGIAHFEEDALHTAVETNDATRLANFQYAAPEQRNKGMVQDKRTDIYALGLMLNEMFTGEIPVGTGYKKIDSIAPEFEYLDSIVETMIRQSPEDRPTTIEQIKMQLIGRKDEFITRQKVSKLKETVVPMTDLDDLLIEDPIRIVSADWERGKLTIVLQHPVNREWIEAFRNMGSHTAVWGKGPEMFAFDKNKAIISAQENEVQRIINYFAEWLPQANTTYQRNMKRKKEQEEAKQREEIERQIQEQEARQRVLNSIKIPGT